MSSAAGVSPARRLAGRVMKFHAVGLIGVAVQLLALAAFKSLLGLDYMVATALAVDGPLAGTAFHGAYTWAGWYYRHFVRDTHIFKPEEAIRRITSLPANRLVARLPWNVEFVGKSHPLAAQEDPPRCGQVLERGEAAAQGGPQGDRLGPGRPAPVRRTRG